MTTMGKKHRSLIMTIIKVINKFQLYNGDDDHNG